MSEEAPPPKDAIWIDDMKKWPSVGELDIFSYLIERTACDLREMKAYKSTSAYFYFLSGCVETVMVSEYNGKVYLTSQVRPSQSVNMTYKCWILVDQNDTISTGGCVCKAGNSAICSHVSAVLYKVNYAVSRGLCGENCTDKQQRWNAGTSQNVIPSTLSSTNLKRPKRNADLHSFMQIKEFKSLPPIKKLLTKTEFEHHCENSVLRDIFNLPGISFNSIMLSLKTSETALLAPIMEATPQQPEAHTDHIQDYPTFDASIGILPCAKCHKFYVELICGSTSCYEELAIITIKQGSAHDQSSVEVWKSSRKLRITASSAFKVPKRSTTDPVRFLNNHVFGKFLGNADTVRGQYGEVEAKKWFEQNTGRHIKSIGTVVRETGPWLSASPDGLIGDDTIIEIKYPDPVKFDEYLKQKSYEVLRTEPGEYTLRTTKSYYLQIQLCMYCVKRKNCVVLLFFGKSRPPVQFEVKYDEAFVMQNILRLKEFYFQTLLPFVVDKTEARALIITKSYKSLFSKE